MDRDFSIRGWQIHVARTRVPASRGSPQQTPTPWVTLPKRNECPEQPKNRTIRSFHKEDGFSENTAIKIHMQLVVETVAKVGYPQYASDNPKNSM